MFQLLLQTTTNINNPLRRNEMCKSKELRNVDVEKADVFSGTEINCNKLKTNPVDYILLCTIPQKSNAIK